MSSPGGGFKIASAYIEVTARDATAADVEAIKARIGKERATLQVAIDSSRVAEEVAAERSRVESERAEIRVGADTGEARAEIDAEVAHVGSQTAQMHIGADTGEAHAEIDELAHKADIRGTLNEDADTGAAEAKIEALRERSQNLHGNVDMAANTSGAESGLAHIIALLGMIAAASGPAIAGLVALGSAGAGAGGVLVGAFSGVIGALGAHKTAMDAAAGASGASAGKQVSDAHAIRDAQQAVIDAETQKARTFASAEESIAKAVAGVNDALEAQAHQAQESADQIQQAEQRVDDAVTQRARTYESSASSVASAEERLASTQRSETTAQQALTDARQAAQDQINGYTRSVADMAANEAGASEAVEEAQLRLAQVLANPLSTDLQRREAQTAVDQAKNQLNDLQAQDADTRAKAAAATAAGVDGDKQVVAAKNAVTDATQSAQDAQNALSKALEDQVYDNQQADRAVADSKRALAKAESDADYQREQSAKSVANARQDEADAETQASQQEADATEAVTKAQQRLADAMSQAGAAAGGGGAGGLNKFNDAMAKLSPAGRAFVNQVLSMQKQLDDLRHEAEEEVLPGFTAMLKVIASPGMWDIAKGVVQSYGREIGQLGYSLANLFQNPIYQRNLAATFAAGLPIVHAFATGIVELADHWAQLGAKAQPVGVGLGNLVSGIFDGINRLLDALQPEMPAIGQLFSNLGKNVGDLLPLLAPAGAGLVNFLNGALPVLDVVLRFAGAHPEVITQIVEAFLGFKTAQAAVSGIVTPIKQAGDAINGIASFGDKLVALPGQLATWAAGTKAPMKAVAVEAATDAEATSGSWLVARAKMSASAIADGAKWLAVTVANFVAAANAAAVNAIEASDAWIESHAKQLAAAVTDGAKWLATTVAQFVTASASAVVQAAVASAAWIAANATMILATGGIVLAVAAVVAIGVELYEHWGTVKQYASDIWNYIRNLFNEVRTDVVQYVTGMITAAEGQFGVLVSTVESIPSRILGALGDLGSLLLNAGSALVNGFLRGIQNAWGYLTSWVSAGMSDLRGLWPFSPAKTGPFSGTGYVTYSGAALTKDFAQSIVDGTPTMVRAATTAMTGVKGALGGTANASLSAAVRGGDGSSLAGVGATIGARAATATAAPATSSQGVHLHGNIVINMDGRIDFGDPTAMDAATTKVVDNLRQALRIREAARG